MRRSVIVFAGLLCTFLGTAARAQPFITSPDAASVPENQQGVMTVTADTPVTFSLTGGADVARFDIDLLLGILEFTSAPDFELPTDANGDNIYVVEVTVTDLLPQTTSQTITVTVTNVPDAPPDITSNGGGATANVSVAENQTAVTIVTATNPEPGTVAFSLTGGPDQAHFVIASSTGVLTFATAPDFENPTDTGPDNSYVVDVTATGAGGTDTQTITVTVTNVPEPPDITSNGGGATAAISIPENQTTVTTVTATNPEGGSVTFSITGGTDQGDFSIDGSSGALSFGSPPDFENPMDAGNNNTYVVDVTATASGGADVQTITVTITNVPDTPPAITSNGGGATASVSVAENQTAVTTVTATNPEPGTLTFSLTGGVDQARFVIASSTGVLTFGTAPDFESPTDTGADNAYVVDVTATGPGGTDTQTITVTVTNVNEPPDITSNGGGATAAISIPENQTAVTTVTAINPEGGPVSFGITGGADQGDFSIDGSSGALSFGSPPDFENPADAGNNNTYVVEVTASASGGADSQTITVTVTNLSDTPPVITSNGGGDNANVSVAENQTAVTTVTATNPEPGTVTFSLTGGVDQARFVIASSTGVLTFGTAPDFESPTDTGADNAYVVDVTATGAGGTDTQTITVTVTNVPEPPDITSNGGGTTAAISIPENQTAVTTVTATNPEQTAISFSLTGGADQAHFTIDGTAGVLTFSAAPDFEAPTDAGANNTYVVEVTATASGGADAQTITVTITNVPDAPPVITSNGGGDTAAVSVAENQTAVTTVTATNPESGTVTFTVTGGADQTRFMIVGATGVLTFVAAPDFEAPADANGDNAYVVDVTATGVGGTDVQTLTVTVTNANEAPTAVADPTYETAEDTPLNAVAPGVLGNDTDPESNPLTAVLVSNVTSGMLALDPDGSFTYTPAQDFTGPVTFTYRAVDNGTPALESAPVAVTITVNPVNDTPVAAGDLYTADEDATLTVNFTVGVLANDADPDGDTLTAVLDTNVANGTLLLNANGSFTYTPNADFSGADSFTYHAFDGTAPDGNSNVVTVAITINAVNDAPELLSPIIAPNAFESVPYTLDLAPFFTDQEGDSLFFSANVGPHPIGLPMSGALLVDPDGSLTGVRGRLFGTPTLADTSDVGPRTVTLTVADRPLFDPAREELEVDFPLTIQALNRIDISLAVSATPSPAPTNVPVNWQFVASNSNPFVAVDSVEVTADFSGTPFTFTNTAACAVNGQALTCTAGPIPASGSATVTVTGQATQAGDVLVVSEASNAMVAGLPIVDPNSDNNTAVTTLSVGQSFSTGPAQTLTSTGAARGVAAGDVDGDGYTDLVVATGSGTGTQLYLSVQMDPNDTNGTEFRRLSTSPISLGNTGDDGQDALLLDLDNDGDLDLAVANGGSGNPQANTVFLNDLVAGQANLVDAGALGDETSYGVATADLDGNGFLDLVFANGSPNEVFLNQGGGVFTAAPSLGNSDSRSVAIADFDGDLRPDLAFANRDGPSHVYRNLGGGNFAAPINVDTVPAVSVRAGDFSGDGVPDLIFGHSEATPPALPADTVFVNTSMPGAITFAGPAASLGVSPTLEVVTADLSLDGIADVVSLNSGGTHQIFVGAGNSSFTLHAQQFSSPTPTGSAVGDFNNDGRLDLAVSGPAGVDLFLNDGLGNLGPGDVGAPTIQLVGEPTITVTVGNPYTDAGATATDTIDGDVTPRIVVTNPVDAAVIGAYTVTYNATDLSGNKAAPVTRTVTVQAAGSSGGGGGGSSDLLVLAFLLLSGILDRLLPRHRLIRAQR